ncbi:cyclic nucleotide-binding domain-containing protein [uncultured Abyssibacter sp.]|uniref:cyclic nucleotide-binding domain-containing protein n=1 Tax=uncultured Abyssibacter sp. TaxID=2320202 RepID=UPI0032B24ADA
MPEALRFEDFAALVPISGLRPENQRDLFKQSQPRPLKSGEFLFHAGDLNTESLYLISGEVALEDETGKALKRIQAGSEVAKHRIAHQIPRSVSARCLGPVTVIGIDNSLLDVLLTWDQTGSFEVHELTPGTAATDTDDWMTRLLQLPAFQMIPAGNLQTLFMRLESIDVPANHVVVQQGDAGDYFYVIDRGHCLVTRESPTHPKPIRLAELGPGMSFGEEALIADSTRNATVTMMSAGTLLRLSKEDFRSLLHQSITRQISREVADDLVNTEGAELIDVRLPSEYKLRHIEGARNLPLYLLRMKLAGLAANKPYVVYCDSGRRSSVAAFIMTQKGFDVRVLDSRDVNLG